jgi:hypothetical protein
VVTSAIALARHPREGHVATHIQRREFISALGGSADDAADIEQGIETFAQKPNSGLIVPPGAKSRSDRRFGDHFRLPAVYRIGSLSRTVA